MSMCSAVVFLMVMGSLLPGNEMVVSLVLRRVIVSGLLCVSSRGSLNRLPSKGVGESLEAQDL